MKKLHQTVTIILISLLLFSSRIVVQLDRNDGLLTWSWRFNLGVFGLDTPGLGYGVFDASFIEAGWKADPFFKGRSDVFFAGIDRGIQRIHAPHKAINTDKEQLPYLLGVRGDYRCNTGMGDLFVVCWLGLGHVFETSTFTPFITIHVGWVF